MEVKNNNLRDTESTVEHLDAKCIRRWSVEDIDNPDARSNPPVTRTMKIFNEMPRPIGVAQRDGLKYNLPPGTNLVRSGLVVQIRYDLNHYSRHSLETLLCSAAVDNSKELQLIKEALLQGKPNAGKFPKIGPKFDIEYVITERELKEHGGVVYIRDLDTVFSLQGMESIKYHPFDKEAGLFQMFDETFKDPDKIAGNNFIYSIKLIDNFGQIGNRWLRIGEEVVEINAVKDESLTDGVYVATRKPSENNLGNQTKIVERYEVDQVTPYFKLHKQYHDARHTNVEELTLKLAQLEVQKLKSETDLQISENNLIKVRTDMERLAQEAEQLKRTSEAAQTKHANDMHNLRMQLEREIQERKTMQEKDRYDALSSDRKNTAEIVKVVPAVVLGLIGIVAAVQKLAK